MQEAAPLREYVPAGQRWQLRVSFAEVVRKVPGAQGTQTGTRLRRATANPSGQGKQTSTLQEPGADEVPAGQGKQTESEVADSTVL